MNLGLDVNVGGANFGTSFSVTEVGSKLHCGEVLVLDMVQVVRYRVIYLLGNACICTWPVCSVI